MRFSVATLLSTAALAVTALAQGVQNAENPFSAPLNAAQLKASVPFSITWTPDTTGTISLILFKGPAANLQQDLTIAANIANSGTFSWTPPVSLEGLETMTAGDGYGIKIVNDATTNFDWSGHFSLSSPASTFNKAVTSSSTSSAGASTSASSSSASESTPTTSATVTSTESSSSASSTSTSTSASSSSSSTSESSSTSSSSSSESTSSASLTSSAPSSTSTAASTTTSTSASSSSAAASTTESSAPSATSAVPEAASSTASSTPTSSPAASKIPTLAIAGIAVGAVAAIAGALVGFFLIRRRRQTHRESHMFGSRGGAYDADFAMMERSRESGGFLSSNYNKMPEYHGHGEGRSGSGQGMGVGEASSRF